MDSCDAVPSGRHSWTALRKIIRSSRKAQIAVACRVPHSFAFRTFPANGTRADLIRLYFLATTEGSRENTICFFDITDAVDGDHVTAWDRILERAQTSDPTVMSREEQLLRERKRLSQFGITSFDINARTGHFVYPVCSTLHRFKDCQVSEWWAGRSPGRGRGV